MYTLVNIDYESYLFDPHYHENADQYTKQIAEFEYVYFLFASEEDVLIHYYDYSIEEINYLKNLGFKIPKMVKKSRINKNIPIRYWWGDKTDKVKNQILNSKLTSIEIGKKLGMGFYKGTTVHNLKEIENHLFQNEEINEWILKNPFGMSGKGHYLFSKNQKLPEHIVKSRPILEPLYDRVCDLGTTYVLHEGEVQERFTVLNFNDRHGQFKGGGSSTNLTMIEKFISSQFKLKLQDLYSDLDKILKEYLKLNPKNNIQIDSFIYKDKNNVFHFYPLVEVNCRKTMGLVINQLAKKHPGLWCEWRFDQTENHKSIFSFDFSLSKHNHQSKVFYFKEFDY